MKIPFSMLPTLAVIFSLAPSAGAANVTVSTTADEVNGTTTSIAALIGAPGGAGISLREAIIAANNTPGADVITLPAGIYTLTRIGNDATCQNGDLDINDSLTITGAGSGSTIIQGAADGNFTGSIGDKVIGINQDGTHPSLSVSVSGITIRYGRNTIATTDPLFAYTGAGVDVFLTGAGNNINFANCVISNNQNVNAYGGGVNVDSANGGVNAGTVTFTGCTIVNNSTLSTIFTATGAGVNLFSDVHNVSFNNCVIANNQTANSASTGGGGGINIRHSFGGVITINNCGISNNTAGGSGGGILTGFNQTVNMTGGSISGNTAGANGGGVSIGSSAGQTTTLTGVTLDGNHANTSSGGGFYVSSGTLNASYCRIVNNTAATGRAAAQSGGTATVNNNWWGTNAPTALMSGTVGFTPWLRLTNNASPNPVLFPNSTTLTASFLYNSAGTAISPANLGALVGVPITFNNPVRGTLSGAQASIQSSGTATATLTANAVGAGSADAIVDGQPVTAPITIQASVGAINRLQASPTNASSVQWTVTFSAAVSGVAAGNFNLVNSGLGGVPGITSVTPVGGTPATTWTVTASTGSGSGTLGLNLVNATGVNAGLANLPFTGQVYTIDLVAPTITCSSNLNVTANGYCPPQVNYTVSVSDNLGLAVATTNPASGSLFPPGTTTVTVGARDTAGNTNFCTFQVSVSPGAAPQLNIQRDGKSLVVSWTNWFPCYALQFAPDLASNTWSSYPGPFTTNNGNIYVTNSAPLTNRFYRLVY